jgi:hypothetical protein
LRFQDDSASRDLKVKCFIHRDRYKSPSEGI